MRRRVHGALAKLIVGRIRAALGILLAALTVPALADTPTPSPTRTPYRINLTKLQPRALLPKQREHTEFLVEINKLGQVTRVRSGKSSKNLAFNAITYGNVLQAFIRTADGHVVLGTYRMTYDYDPKTGRVRRSVALVSRGGVNPDAQGAALDVISHAHPRTPPPGGYPKPLPSLDPRTLPDLRDTLQASPTPGH
jgi:hypothetical protein